MMKTLALALGLAAAACTTAAAQTRVTLKSATAGTSYYVMTVQLGEALRTATGGRISATVEESQGSVQNVKEAPRRQAGYVFTTPPGLIRDAVAGKKPFEGESGYEDIRTLFMMPGITMHFVVRADLGIGGIAGLEGKTFIPGGRGTFTQRQSDAVFKLLGLEGKVKIGEVELSAAPAALRNRQVDGFATGSAHPTSMLQELGATIPIRILSLGQPELDRILAADASASPVTIPAGTYPGQTAPVATFGLPVGAFTTAKTDEQTAYEIVKSFWAQQAELAKTNPVWGPLKPAEVMGLGIRLHPGAAKYYAEAGVAIPDAMK